jgi:hypothetical protein
MTPLGDRIFNWLVLAFEAGVLVTLAALAVTGHLG